MQGGNLANDPVPRLVIVFENGLGFLPDSNRDAWRKAARRERWRDALACFELDPLMLRMVVDLTYRFSVSIDVVTYCGPDQFAVELAGLLDRENVPVRVVTASSPEQVARSLAYQPDVVRIYDGNEGHAWAYGRKGVYLTSHTQLGQ